MKGNPFQRVSTAMWRDSGFLRLPDDTKLLWCRLLTGPERTSLPGLIVTGRAALAEAMGWEVDRFRIAFDPLTALKPWSGRPMARADWSACVVWMPRAVYHCTPANPNIVLGWQGPWNLVPECDLKEEARSVLSVRISELGTDFVRALRRVLGNGFGNRLANGSVNGLGNRSSRASRSESESESESVPESKEDPESIAVSRPSTSPPSAPDSFPPSDTESSGTRTALPPDFALTDERRAYAEQLGVQDPAEVFETFRLMARERAWAWADWDARWQRFCRKEVIFQREAREAKRSAPALRAAGAAQSFDPSAPWLQSRTGK